MRHFLLVAATAAAVLAGPAAGFAQTAAAPGCPTAKVVTASGGYGGQQAQNLTGNGYGPRLASGEAPCQ
jgi:hypothetical protein